MTKGDTDTRDEMYQDFRKDAGCSSIAIHWANLVFDLGYRKVTLCEKCKGWAKDDDMSNMKNDDGTNRRWCLIRGGYMRADGYCSEGEPKEAPCGGA